MPEPASVPGAVAVGVMRRRHLRGVVEVEVASNPHPWSLDLFEAELRQPSSHGVVAVAEHSVVVGFGCLMTTGFETHITNVGVSPDRRRQGIGRRVVSALLRRTLDLGLDDVTLEVRTSNIAAQQLYRRFGFAPGGLRPRYYADNGEDALIMWANGIGSPEGLERLAELESVRP